MNCANPLTCCYNICGVHLSKWTNITFCFPAEILCNKIAMCSSKSTERIICSKSLLKETLKCRTVFHTSDGFIIDTDKKDTRNNSDNQK